MSTAGCTFSAYSAGGSFKKAVLLCHLKYGTTPSTKARAAVWLNGTEVMHSYASSAATVGVATDFCAATDALTCAQGVEAFWRAYNCPCRGEDRATEARDKPAAALVNRTIFAAVVSPKHLRRTDAKKHDAGGFLCIYTHAAIKVLGVAIAADRGISLEPLWEGIIAAVTTKILDNDPCMVRQIGLLPRMRVAFVIKLKLTSRSLCLNDARTGSCDSGHSKIVSKTSSVVRNVLVGIGRLARRNENDEVAKGRTDTTRCTEEEALRDEQTVLQDCCLKLCGVTKLVQAFISNG
jgi:hypothetical protein